MLAQNSEDELRRIANEISAERDDVLSSSVDIMNNTADIEVYVATEELQREMDETYGEGVVRLTGWLQPVP